MKCHGCGADLQNLHQSKIGYSEKLTNQYCLRCFKMKHYKVVIPQEITPAQFTEQLASLLVKPNELKHRLFYYVIDIFDIELSRNHYLETLLANEKVTILVNKVDLMPKAVKRLKLQKYFQDLFATSPLTNYQVFLVSKNNTNSLKFLQKQLEKQNTNEQYFIGHSNVGKSSLINALLKQNKQSENLVTAPSFHTTLNFLPVKINDYLTIIDTPGLNREDAWNYYVTPNDLKYLHFQKELLQYTYQIESGQSLIIGGLISVNFSFPAEQKIDLHYYAYQHLDIHRTKTNKSNDYLQKHQLELHPEPQAELINNHFLTYQPKIDVKTKRFDLSLGNLGWINVPNIPKLNITVSTNINLPSRSFQNLLTVRKPLV
ncbi:hypothetical protein JN01_0606 [Entomoplasma freundtii]|uniref:GTP-binding protein YqeH n=1 Tax=Entomoplasma freundtii TaxID=74700 RepID=A0A2K8NUP9_9MOLU|nr:GTPase RsgA [Entomoplasma freundtii]ATZ16353.1 GTP-binding protein YqeH [Entomoplasma freundtii]TDY56608.1 hypothetical protein JN01_0606 [Entomoplasma freundtii]